MSFVLGLAPCGTTAGDDVLAQVEAYAQEACRAGVSLLVFPENLLPVDGRVAQPLDGPFAHGVANAACRYGLWIVFTMGEKPATDGAAGSGGTDEEPELPFNTAVVVDDTGEVRGTYRKCHLYDAHGVRESDRMRAGDALCDPIRTPFCTLGVGICYDLRFPEVARALALAGCDLLLFPAAWHDGPRKARHWRGLLQARAIENECFVAGVCHSGPLYVRRSHVFGPLGEPLAEGEGGGLLTCTVDLAAVAAARDAMPVFSHRRPELY